MNLPPTNSKIILPKRVRIYENQKKQVELFFFEL